MIVNVVMFEFEFKLAIIAIVLTKRIMVLIIIY